MLIIITRTIILYLVVMAALRLMGKKQLGELQPSELVTTIIISNIATISLEDPNLPMISGIIPIFILVSLDILASFVMLKRHKLRRFATGTPKMIIAAGVINQTEMHNLRYTLDDLAEAMRDSGTFDISEVDYAIVETTGKINVLAKNDNLSPNNLAINVPGLIIKDGVIDQDEKNRLRISDTDLRKILEENEVELREVFLLSIRALDNYYLVKKDNKR